MRIYRTLCVLVFVHLLNCFVECWIQSKTFTSLRFKFNQVDQQVIFIATSDDPKWLKANLRGVNNDLYFSADLFAGVQKIICSRDLLNFHPDGRRPSPGEDLAVLSLCNHSIIGVRRVVGGGQEGEFGQNMEVCALLLVVYSGIHRTF